MASASATKLLRAAALAKQASDSPDSDGNSANSNDSQRGIKSSTPQPSNTLHAAVAALKSPSSSSINKTRSKAGGSKLKTAALAIKFSGANTPWGDYDHLNATDIASLSNEKLKRHLRARGELAEGTKQELIERLRNSLEEERQKKLALELELEAKHRKIADAEEKGAVYVTGKNNNGQLGLGDLRDRHQFTVIPSTRGKRFQHVSTGGNVVLATTDCHEVYAWGGSGFGSTGLNSNQKFMYKTPQLVEKLNGEETIMTALGANHACAASLEGDVFLWGLVGQSEGTAKSAQTPQPQYTDKITATAIACGEMHTCVKTKDDDVFSFGHSANGRLGIGAWDNDHQTTPLPVHMPTLEVVTLIACGSEHTLMCTQSCTYSFGCGDGGRLGHGPDFSDRYEPCEVISLRGSHILSMSAGTWHSACVVHVPPLDVSGWLYTWGSGFQGQLGLGQICKATTPTIVQAFVDEGLSIRQIFCGSHHNAAIVDDGNQVYRLPSSTLYTWGSNSNGALGRHIGESKVPFTPQPGIVPEFGTIVNRIGRGLPLSVACGREYTIVTTQPYNGPTEEEALTLAEERRMKEMEEEQRQKAILRAKEEELKRLQEIEAEKKKIQYLTSKRLCTMDSKCPGFTYETNQPSICRECGYSVVYHTVVAEETKS